jgi:hypothetical protein
MDPFKTFSAIAALTLCSSFAVAQETAPVSTASPRLSLTLERVGGVALGHVAPEDSDSLDVTTATLGGALHNPMMAPRVGVDWLSPSGLTVGGALSATAVKTTVDDVDLSGVMVLVSPRVGYRAVVSDHFDVIPRLGLTFATGSLKESESGSECWEGGCEDSSYESKGSFAAGAASAEVLGVIRATSSFNLLVAASYDQLLFANGRLSESYSGEPEETERGSYDGGAFTLGAWVGVGGYF